MDQGDSRWSRDLDESCADVPTSLASAFADRGLEATCAPDLGLARTTARTRPCAVAVVDARLSPDGLAAIQALGGLAAVVLVGVMSPRARAQVLDAGAADCLAGPADVRELALRVRGVARRLERAARAEACARAAEPPAVSLADVDALALPARERAMLEVLLAHAGSAVSTADLYREAWGAEPAAGVSNVVAVHVNRLRKRLAPLLGPGAIQTQWGGGYRLNARRG